MQDWKTREVGTDGRGGKRKIGPSPNVYLKNIVHSYVSMEYNKALIRVA